MRKPETNDKILINGVVFILVQRHFKKPTII